MRCQRGVTLVALVVTIIILIILAGVSIGTLVGDNSIITIAQKAKENIQLAQLQEEKQLNTLQLELEKSLESEEDAENLEMIQTLQKELAKLSEEVNLLKNQINKNTFYINPNEIIDVVCNGSNLTQVEYTASEDCIIAGYVRTWSDNSSAEVKINGITIYILGGSDTDYGDCKGIYIPLKEGQTITISFNSNNNGSNIIKAYRML